MNNDSKLVGASYAVLMSTLPAWWLDTATKIGLAVITAFLTGLAYQAGRRLLEKK